ncbi:acyltransferase family protein [Massilia sp. GCM10023247]|uniref:acyltransferase family protein n=1 Tax=Massilia sp. GCM10023247 TaxID=3252643 RepID=UPI00360DDDEB
MRALSFHVQRQSQLSEDSMQSLLMNLLRGIASLQVAAAHLRAEVYPGLRGLEEPGIAYMALAFFTGFAHQAVMVFFLISGWLVGGSLLNKLGQPRALRSYAIDRATRLWTVLVPTLLMMLGIGLVTGAVVAEPAGFGAGAGEFSAGTFVGNVLGLQTILVDKFGGNYPLWSLANETWYYIQFPLLVLIFTGRGILQQGACAILLGLTVAFLPYVMTLYFAIWLLGAVFSRIRVETTFASRMVLLALAVAVSVYYRVNGNNDDILVESFGQDLACSLPVIILLASMHAPTDRKSAFLRRLGTFGKWLSEFSFTLYVLHVPVIYLMQHIGRTQFGRDKLDPASATDFALYFGMLAILMITAYLSYLVFERNTYRVRRFAKKVLMTNEVKTPAAAVLSSRVES